MRNKNILEKIIFCFKYKNIDEQQYEAMKRNLASKGISIRFIQTDEENAGIEELRKNVESRENILWICDYEIDRTSEDAVLIYQHERNTDLSFEGYQYFIEGFEDADADYYEKTYQRIKRIPWLIAETKRLYVREMQEEDLTELYELYKESDLTPFLPPLYQNREEEREYLKRYITHMYGIFEYGMWVLQEKETGKVIGRMGVENTDCEEELSFGFMLAVQYRKKGYATEAGLAVKEYMREKFPALRLIAFCHPHNADAIRLCERLDIQVKKCY